MAAPLHPHPTGGQPSAVDWDLLTRRAQAAMRSAYAPYSQFPVGAAGLLADGRIEVGCNVENAAYGVGLCAECVLVGQVYASAPPDSAPRLVAVAVVDRAGEPLMPCGRCRQLLWEAGGPDAVIRTAGGVRTFAEILPDAFDAGDLAANPTGDTR